MVTKGKLKCKVGKNIVEEFNEYFAPKAKAVIIEDGIEDRLEITVDGKTMVISLPQVVGWQGAVKDSSSDA